MFDVLSLGKKRIRQELEKVFSRLRICSFMVMVFGLFLFIFAMLIKHYTIGATVVVCLVILGYYITVWLSNQITEYYDLLHKTNQLWAVDNFNVLSSDLIFIPIDEAASVITDKKYRITDKTFILKNQNDHTSSEDIFSDARRRIFALQRKTTLKSAELQPMIKFWGELFKCKNLYGFNLYGGK